MITVISGCSTLEGGYENSLLSFTIPENWTVDNSNSSDSLASLKTWDNQWIYIQSSDVDPTEIIESYIQNYPVEYPRFQVINRDPVQVDGRECEKLVYKNTAQNDFLLLGPDYISSVIAFRVRITKLTLSLPGKHCPITIIPEWNQQLMWW